MDLGLKGKTALVLGGGGGLGSAIAKALASEGMNVAIADIDAGAVAVSVASLSHFGVRTLGLTWDLGDLSLIDTNVSRIEADLGGSRRACQQYRRASADTRWRSGSGGLDQALPIHGRVGNRDHRSSSARHAAARLGPHHHEHFVWSGQSNPEPWHIQRTATHACGLV